jgi:hypothetical protein
MSGRANNVVAGCVRVSQAHGSPDAAIRDVSRNARQSRQA